MPVKYFSQSDLHKIEAIFNYKAKTGVGFALTPNDEQVFISSRTVEELELQLGDTIVAYAVDNRLDARTEHFPSRWRAVRVELVRRLDEAVSAAPNTVLAPAVAPPSASPTDFVGVMDVLLKEPRMWTVNALAHALVEHSPTLAAFPDLLQKAGGRLATMHKNGEVACVKVYAKGEQDRASAVYYAKDADVIYEHLDTPLGEGEEA